MAKTKDVKTSEKIGSSLEKAPVDRKARAGKERRVNALPEEIKAEEFQAEGASKSPGEELPPVRPAASAEAVPFAKAETAIAEKAPAAEAMEAAVPEEPDGSPRRSVAFIGSECYPFVKTGGLGDVMYALPKALVE